MSARDHEPTTCRGDAVGATAGLVERVARALARLHYAASLPQCLDLAVEDGWRDFIPEARAAIEAMLEPTEAMVAATDDHDNCWGYQADGRPSGPEECWGAMIRAALDEAAT